MLKRATATMQQALSKQKWPALEASSKLAAMYIFNLFDRKTARTCSVAFTEKKV
jgi:hypothetical protein